MFFTGIGTATPPRRYTKAECWNAFQESDWFARLDRRSHAIAEAVLLRAAENLVLNRPGERDEHLMAYVERLSQLEEVASSFQGVQRAYAMRAGKEVRVIVEAARVGDQEVGTLSKDIATRIEKDVKYPGMVKVSVIRETRAVDYAT